MTYAVPAELLRAALDTGDQENIRNLVTEFKAADLAEFLRDETPETAIRLLTALPLKDRAEVVGYLPPSQQREIALALSEVTLAALLSQMSSDERADLFKLFDEDYRESLLRRLARAEREDLRRLASYEEGSAGSVMSSDYVFIPVNARVADALEILRATAPNKETIYQTYVVDRAHRLVGTVSLRELILAKPSTPVSDLMISDVISAQVDTPREEVARLIARYDLIALPILNHDGKLVGIVTYDDAMDVAEEEATEDMLKSATVGKLEGGLRNVSLFTLYRKRIVWLALLVFANIFSGAGIAYFEETIAAYVALLFFLPLLIASGGNAGSQAATLMIRGLATGDVGLQDWAKLLGRELLVSTGLGLTMALAVSVIGIFRGGTQISLVVSLSMVVIVVAGSLIGMGLPFLLDRLGWDSASASTPLVTTIADITGVLVYFSIATAILGLPPPS